MSDSFPADPSAYGRDPVPVPWAAPSNGDDPNPSHALKRRLLHGAFGQQGDAVVAFFYTIVTAEALESAAVDLKDLALKQVVAKVATVLVDQPQWRGGLIDVVWLEQADRAESAAVAGLWRPGDRAAQLHFERIRG